MAGPSGNITAQSSCAAHRCWPMKPRPKTPRFSSCMSSCRLRRQQPGSLLPGPSSWRRTTPPYCACSTCPGADQACLQ
eukprot:jgi/Astpho2/8619/Aster-05097